MPAIQGNAKNFLLNTDYPLDKVVYQRTYSVPIAAFDFNDVSFAHGLPFTPLVTARWSTNSNLIPTYNISSGPTISTGNAYNTGINADATNINLNTSNNTGSAVTLYFSIYGFMPSSVNTDMVFTASSGDAYAFNTDYNYTKLFMDGTVNTPTGTGSQTVIHGLGYIPQVALWLELSSLIYPVVFNSVSTTVAPFNTLNYYADSNSVVIEYYATTSARIIHYRIYLDE